MTKHQYYHLLYIISVIAFVMVKLLSEKSECNMQPFFGFIAVTGIISLFKAIKYVDKDED